MKKLERKMRIHGHGAFLGVVGELGGIHISIHSTSDGSISGGLEIHNKKPVYDFQKCYHNCWMLNGDCYPDGSTLRFIGEVRPIIEQCNKTLDFEPVWHMLEQEYYGRFNNGE